MSDLKNALSRLSSGIALSGEHYVPRAPGSRLVWYCTNRNIRDLRAAGTARFSNDCGKRAYGMCVVTVREDRMPGEIERNAFDFFTGLRKDRLIGLAREIPQSDFDQYGALEQEIGKTKGRHSILFVHGYNVSFTSAVERAAQLAEDLRISGEVFSFSWPSQGSFADYVADQDRASKSIDDLIEWMRLIIAAMGNEHEHVLHLVAHSMGNRILLPAVLKVFDSGPIPFLGEIISAAADADVDNMMSWLSGVAVCARRVNIYASATDLALRASKRFHKSSRFGMEPSSDVRWDTIHCDGTGDDAFKHSYIFQTPTILADIRAALNFKPYEERYLLHYREPRTWKLSVK